MGDGLIGEGTSVGGGGGGDVGGGGKTALDNLTSCISVGSTTSRFELTIADDVSHSRWSPFIFVIY